MSLMLAQQVQALDYFVMFNLVIMLVFVKRQVFKNIFDTLIDMPLRAGEIFPLPPFETVTTYSLFPDGNSGYDDLVN